MSTDLKHAIVESHDEYHRQSGKCLSSHLLQAFRRSPREYQMRLAGEISTDESAAMRFGRAFHCLVLEGDIEFCLSYEVGGPINPKTGRPYGSDTKAVQDYAAKSGKTIISTEDYGTMCEMAANLAQHAAAQQLLADTLREAVFRRDILSVPCQARCDAVATDRIVDLKTLDDIDDFERHVRTYEYVHQLALYADVASGQQPAGMQCWFVVCEKRPPNRVGVWELSRSSVEWAGAENRSAIRALKALRESRPSTKWPTGYEDIRFLMIS